MLHSLSNIICELYLNKREKSNKMLACLLISTSFVDFTISVAPLWTWIYGVGWLIQLETYFEFLTLALWGYYSILMGKW